MARIEDTIGISYRQLDHWAKEGYLRPDTSDVQRRWPEEEIQVGKMMARLVAIGITPSKAAEYARSAVVEQKPMLLAFEGGKLKARGAFSSAIREHQHRQQEAVSGRKARPLDRKEAC